MICLDCNKPYAYPVIDRKTGEPICPACFGTNVGDVHPERLDFARSQKWYFDKPEPECKVAMVVVPDTVHTADWWLGYVLHEGGKFQLMPIGTEAEIDSMIESYKLAGGYMCVPFRSGSGSYEVVQVYFAVKLRASEALRIVPRATEVIDA